MTAEIAIINRTGIALAADSAATIGRERVWKNSNKLFHLAPSADVAVMIFGHGSHCGLPWEVVIKQYRRKLGSRTFEKLQEYTEDFLLFLDDLTTPHPIHSDLNTYAIMLNLIDDVNREVKNLTGKNARRKRFVAELVSIATHVEESPLLFDDYSRENFSQKHRAEIRSFLEEKADVLVTKPVLSAMITACFELCRRAVPSGSETGVVFAGFGDKELLPVLEEICVDGTLDGKVRAWTVRHRNMNETDNGGMVIPFAQSDIAHLFIEGLLPEYLEFVEKTMQGTLDQKSRELVKDYVPEGDRTVEEARELKANTAMTAAFLEEFKKYRREVFVQPMMKVVSSLPKEEMAAVAEALVEATSLRRKMDSSLETVGGPVDVAIISKSDGFVWIKRKHYFNLDLNTDFIERRTQRYSGGE